MITQLSAEVRAPECLLKRAPAGQNPSRARSWRKRARSNLRPLSFATHRLLREPSSCESLQIQSAEPVHMATLSIRSPGLNSVGISVLLLVILLQVLLLHFFGVFIHSEKVLIGPVIFCENNQYDKLICSHSGQKMYSIGEMLALCFYVPIVLVAFALLCMLLAAYAKDRTTLRCGMVCQTASALLTLGGIITFLAYFHSYLSWKDMTFWFYLCVGVEVQLIVTTVLTRVLGQKLTSDWE